MMMKNVVKAKPKQNYYQIKKKKRKIFGKIINTRFIGMSIISKYIPFGIIQFWVCELEFFVRLLESRKLFFFSV